MTNISMNQILQPFLIDKYNKIKNNILTNYKDVYLNDLKNMNEYEINYMFTDMMIESVNPENKILSYFFVKNNSKEIIQKIKLYLKQII